MKRGEGLGEGVQSCVHVNALKLEARFSSRHSQIMKFSRCELDVLFKLCVDLLKICLLVLPRPRRAIHLELKTLK